MGLEDPSILNIDFLKTALSELKSVAESKGLTVKDVVKNNLKV